MSTVRRGAGIQLGGDGVHVPGRPGWVVVPVPAYMDPLGEFGPKLVGEACAQGSSILLDTFFLSGNDDQTLEVLCGGRDPEDVLNEIRMYTSIPNALLTLRNSNLYLLTGHDETSLLIGQRTELETVAHRSAEVLLDEYHRYATEEWLGSMRDNMLRLLTQAEAYNDAGREEDVVLPF